MASVGRRYSLSCRRGVKPALTTLHIYIILKSRILCYPDKVSLLIKYHLQAVGHGVEAFLSGRVPEVDIDGPTADGQPLQAQVDSDRRGVTLPVLAVDVAGQQLGLPHPGVPHYHHWED